MNNSYSIETKTTEKLVNDVLNVKATQTKINKGIAETCQNMTSKYHAIEMKISEMHNEVKKVQVGKDQGKAQSAKDSHSKNPRWKKKQQTNNRILIP